MGNDLTRPIVLRPGDGRSIDLGNFAMSVKASGDDTGGAFALLEAAEPPDFGPPMHIHHDAAEAFYVLEGEYRIFIHEQTFACPAGSFIFIPAGIEHGSGGAGEEQETQPVHASRDGRLLRRTERGYQGRRLRRRAP